MEDAPDVDGVVVLDVEDEVGMMPQRSDTAKWEGLHRSTVKALMRLTLLEPAIIQAILAGRQPRCMSLLCFQRDPLPLD